MSPARFQSAHLHEVRCRLFTLVLSVDISIRAPARGAMATHSKIRLIRTLTITHRAQNRHDLGNPRPRKHPCIRPLREKTHRFYDHLRFTLRPFTLAYLTISVSRLQNFSRPAKATFFWSNHVTQPSDEFDLARQSTTSPILSFGLSTRLHLQKV